MKIKKLKKTIIINSSIAVVLIASFVAISIFIFNLNNISLQKIRQIKAETGITKAKTAQNNKKLIDIAKYEKKWTNLSDKEKSTRTIKSTEVKEIVDALSKKYHIKDMQFAMQVPQKLNKGQFKKGSIEVYLTTGKISLGSTDDIKALKFVQELSTTLPGYMIIEKLSLNKNKEYTEREFVALSQTGSISKVRTRIQFHWYSKKSTQEKEK